VRQAPASALAVGAQAQAAVSGRLGGDEGWRGPRAVQAAAIKPLPGARAATASIKTRRRSKLGGPATPQLS